MDEVNDQVQQDSPAPNEGAQDQASAEQSDTSTSEQELYELPDGRKVEASELSKEWKENFYPEFTRRSQELKVLQEEAKKWEESAQKEAVQAVSENEYLKDVDPNVREAIVQIVTPVIENRLQQKDAEEQRRAQDEAFAARLEELKTKYPGGDGLPKFEETKILQAMQEEGNSNYDPEALFKMMHWDAFMDHANKQAMKGKSSGTKTEDTGGSQPRKPDKKTPKTFEEAGKSALSRM